MLVYMFWGFFAILFCLLKNICLDKRLPFCYYKINLITQVNKIKMGEDLMEKELIAHVRRDRSTGEVIATQSLKEHSSNAAELCSENCRVANLSQTGEAAGFLHDGASPVSRDKPTSRREPGKESTTPPRACATSGSIVKRETV